MKYSLVASVIQKNKWIPVKSEKYSIILTFKKRIVNKRESLKRRSLLKMQREGALRLNAPLKSQFVLFLYTKVINFEK